MQERVVRHRCGQRNRGLTHASCRSDQRQRDNEASVYRKVYRTARRARLDENAEPFQALSPACLGCAMELHRDDVGGCSGVPDSRSLIGQRSPGCTLPTRFRIQGLGGGSAMASCLQGPAWLPCASSLGCASSLPDPLFHSLSLAVTRDPWDVKKGATTETDVIGCPQLVFVIPALQSTTHLWMMRNVSTTGIVSVPRRLRSAGPTSFFFFPLERARILIGPAVLFLSCIFFLRLFSEDGKTRRRVTKNCATLLYTFTGSDPSWDLSAFSAWLPHVTADRAMAF